MKEMTRAGPAAMAPLEPYQRASVHLPTTFREIVDEIVRFTDISREEVEHRVWMQALEPGSNVLEDVRRFGATPHEYDDQMLRLYRDGNGFIYETMVFWPKPMRSRWTHQALERIRLYADRIGRSAEQIDILILGDGVGNDSLFLAEHGFRVHYFDVPGSRTYEFAMKRFEHYDSLGDRIRPVPDYASCLQGRYDVVLCFEVLEHLPDPVQAIRELGTMLKKGGIALITEDFGDIVDRLPTHLRISSGLVGTTPFLFLNNRMVLSWYSREWLFKPMEFVKVERLTLAHRWQLLRDPWVRGAYLGRYLSLLMRRLNKLLYLGG
jgi:SAM-dependent methyltransferase